MSYIVKSEIIKKAKEIKEQILKYKNKKNIFQEVMLQLLENQLKELIDHNVEIEEWEWMGWSSKEEYEKECAVIRGILEKQFENKKTFNDIFDLKLISTK